MVPDPQGLGLTAPGLEDRWRVLLSDRYSLIEGRGAARPPGRRREPKRNSYCHLVASRASTSAIWLSGMPRWSSIAPRKRARIL